MELSLLNELGEILSQNCETKCNIIQLENIFRFVLNLETEMGSSSVNRLKDILSTVIKEHSFAVSLEIVNNIANTIFIQDSELKKKFLTLFSNELKDQSPDEFEEIDIDQDPSLSHHKETFHMTGPCIVTDSSLYGTDKCPCVCHTEHHSVKHCFTCAIQFVQGCTYTTSKRSGMPSVKHQAESSFTVF